MRERVTAPMQRRSGRRKRGSMKHRVLTTVYRWLGIAIVLFPWSLIFLAFLALGCSSIRTDLTRDELAALRLGEPSGEQRVPTVR
jgi:hypothetical protein